LRTEFLPRKNSRRKTGLVGSPGSRKRSENENVYVLLINGVYLLVTEECFLRLTRTKEQSNMFSLMNRNNNDTFDVFLEDFTSRGRHNGTTRPRATIDENDKGYSITVEMPGLSRSDIEVSTENDCLTVSGTRESGRGKTTYTRSWSLGENVTQEGITARYDAGLLHIEVPVVKSKKRLISVE